MIQKISAVVLGAGVALGGLTACNDRDVAIGAGAVGGAIIAGSIYDNYYHRDYRHSRGHYRGGGSYWDRHDGRYYRCGGRWCRDSRYRPRPYPYSMGLAMTSPDMTTMANVAPTAAGREAAVAAKYRVSTSAARQVGDAFASVERYGKMDGFRALGLTDSDMAAMQKGADASEASVGAMAKNLDAKRASVRALLTDVRDEYSLYKQGGVN